jgi:large subunit ribosomal protein L17
MRHQKKTIKLDRHKSVRELMLRNLASSLIIHEKIQTTVAKAKAVQPIMEKLIYIAKKNDLISRRLLLRYLFTEGVIVKILNILGPRYSSRVGGYTRIINIGSREGDRAQIAQIEFV